jgi:hypothetical protein
VFTSRIDSSAKSWKPDEIINQVALMRTRKAVGGHVHFSMVALMENRQGIADQLKAVYPAPALTPAMPWLVAPKPLMPTVNFARARPGSKAVKMDIIAQPGDRQYAVWMRFGGAWKLLTLTATGDTSARAITVPLPGESESPGMPDAMAISTVDRFGNESERVMLTTDDFSRAR